MLLHIALSQTQRPQDLVYFNGSASVTTNSGFNLSSQQITFQFRTCLGGELFSLTDSGKSVSLSLNDSGSLVVTWNSGTGEETMTVGGLYNLNVWTLVDIQSVSGLMVLSIRDLYGEIAEIVDLPSLAPVNGFVLGTGYTGCLEEVQGISLANSIAWSAVSWGECPLNEQVGCGEWSQTFLQTSCKSSVYMYLYSRLSL